MTGRERRVRITVSILCGVVVGMAGLSLASSELYRMFCQATGYGGTPKTENVARSKVVTDGQVTVRFDANVNSALPWRFHPEKRQVRLRLGEEALVYFTAANLADQPVTGTATFNVVPEKVAQYFSKLECFCFTEQTLAPGQEVNMPVVFFVDPALAEDSTARDATTITLSYTFFRAEGDGGPQGTARKIVATPVARAGG
jgi:cytochrome c oxidase assembly protein subunit 11